MSGGGQNYMDLSNMPLENKQEQTMMWQQNQYMGDSGIHSGATTQAPSISSKGGHHDDIEEPQSNMETSHMQMFDWPDQQYSQQGYTQEQIDGQSLVFDSYSHKSISESLFFLKNKNKVNDH